MDHDAQTTTMSDQEDSKKSGANYAILLGILIIVMISLFLVPFATIGLAIKKSGFLGQQPADDSSATAVSTKKSVPKTPDLSALRAVVEKAASNALADPTKLVADKDGFQIQVAPPATIDSASDKVQDVLTKNHFQFVEAYDHELIRIIVILKSSQWPELARMLSQATDLAGFQYRGPSETKSATNSSDTTIAKIEILRRSSQ